MIGKLFFIMPLDSRGKPTSCRVISGISVHFTRVRVLTTLCHIRDVKNGIYCCYSWHVTLIVKIGGMFQPLNLRFIYSYDFQTKVVQSKGWLSVGCSLTQYPEAVKSITFHYKRMIHGIRQMISLKSKEYPSHTRLSKESCSVDLKHNIFTE